MLWEKHKAVRYTLSNLAGIPRYKIFNPPPDVESTEDFFFFSVISKKKFPNLSCWNLESEQSTEQAKLSHGVTPTSCGLSGYCE